MMRQDNENATDSVILQPMNPYTFFFFNFSSAATSEDRFSEHGRALDPVKSLLFQVLGVDCRAEGESTEREIFEVQEHPYSKGWSRRRNQQRRLTRRERKEGEGDT